MAPVSAFADSCGDVHLVGAGLERDRPRGELRVDRPPDRQAEAPRFRPSTEELDELRASRDRIDAERRAALDESTRLRAALDQMGQALQEARIRHEVAYSTLDREYEEARGRWQREREAGEARMEQARTDLARRMTAAVRLAEERADAAGRQHACELASLREQFDKDRGALRAEIEGLLERAGTAQREQERTALELGAVARERDLLVTAGAELRLRVRGFESDLSTAVSENERARDELRRQHEELGRFHELLERAQEREQAAAVLIAELEGQARAREVELVGQRRAGEAERMKWQQRLAALQGEMEAREREWEGALAEVRRRSRSDLRGLEEESERWRHEAEHLSREKDLALSDVKTLVQDREALARTVGELEIAREEAEERSRAELARLAAELMDSGRRCESLATRNEEQCRENARLRAELDRWPIRPESSAPRTRQDLPAGLFGGAGDAEVTTARARSEEGRADHHGVGNSELFSRRAGLRGAGARAVPDGGDLLGVGVPVPARPARQPEESPIPAFPDAADLALVRGQAERLTELLSAGRSSGPVLIYQRDLAEFSRRIREVSRLATKLVNEVEASAREDEAQYHLYLIRRAEEIG
jgi:chromosome segregation ATPase